MSTCQYPRAVSTRLSREDAQYVERKAAQLGISRAEAYRAIIRFYRQAHEEGCPECETVLSIQT